MSDSPKKAVILARGLGSRMRKEAPDAQMSAEQAAIAQTGVKAMISVGRPFLDHVISELADAGFTDVCLVIGPEHDVIREYYDNIPKSRVKVSYAIQVEPLGTANAVLAAEEFAAGEPILILNSDNFYPPVALRALAATEGSAVAGFDRAALIAQSNIPEDRVAAFALLELNEDGTMADVVEKPSAEKIAEMGPEAPLSMNCWRCSATIFEAAKQIDPSPRGEYEITDAVRKAIELGDTYEVVPVAAGVLDLSNQGDISSVTEALKDHQVAL